MFEDDGSDPTECHQKIDNMDIGLSREKTAEAIKDALAVCKYSGHVHLCGDVMKLIQKWTYYGYES